MMIDDEPIAAILISWKRLKVSKQIHVYDNAAIMPVGFIFGEVGNFSKTKVDDKLCVFLLRQTRKIPLNSICLARARLSRDYRTSLPMQRDNYFF